MDLDVRNEGAVSVLTLPGKLNSMDAETLKLFLRRSLDQAGRLIVNCERVSSLDPDCLRVLCAAYRISRALRKEIIVAGNRPWPFLKQFRETDQAACRSCELDSGDACLWGAR